MVWVPYFVNVLPRDNKRIFQVNWLNVWQIIKDDYVLQALSAPVARFKMRNWKY